MPPKAKPTAPPSDADAPFAPTIRRKTRNTTKKGETLDVEASTATIGRKTRQHTKASSKEEDPNTGEMSNATSSTPYEENESQTPCGTGTDNSLTPAGEFAHVEETRGIHAMQSNALQSPVNETTSPEAPMETPGTGPACTETPGVPEPKEKGKARNSLDEALSVEDGCPTPKASMYGLFCCVLWE